MTAAKDAASVGVMVCVGFGEFENNCTSVAGTRWSPYWCERCNALRLDYIAKQFEAMAAEGEAS